MRSTFAVRASRATKKRVWPSAYATPTTILLLSAFLGSCGDSVSFVVDIDETPESRWEEEDPSANLTQTSAITDTPVVGTILAEPVVVRVKDRKGRSFVDLPVTWTVSDRTGGVGASAGGGFSATFSTRLNAQGESSVIWRLGTISGSQSITASVAGPGKGKSKTVTSTLEAMVVAGPPAELTVSPAQARVEVADRQDLDASVMDEFGNDVEDVVVAWSSAVLSVASVDTAGTVTGENIGITVVSASVANLVEDAIVEVVSNSPALGSLAITPGSVSRSVGQTAQLSVTAVDSLGSPITPLIGWASRDPSVATVNGTGLVTAIAEGTTFVFATSGCCDADSVPVTVTNAGNSPALGSLLISPDSVSSMVGETVQLSVTAVDSLGNSITPPVGWVSGDPSVATVSDTGLLTATGTGNTFVTASSGCCESHSIPVTVVNGLPDLGSLTISPGSVSRVVGETAQLSVTAVDPLGNPITPLVGWESRDPSVATVDGTGLVTATGTGTTFVVATGGCCDPDSIPVTVEAGPPALGALTIAPESVSRTVGETAQLSVTAVDSLGNAITPVVGWETRDPSVATINGAGLLTAIGDGVTFVVATGACCEPDSIPVTVESGTPALGSLTITPESVSRTVGETAQLSVNAVDSLGNPITPVVGWETRDPSVATINGAGLLTATGEGGTFVVVTGACCEADSIPVTVESGTPALGTITITPGSVWQTVGETTQLSVNAVDSLGNPISPLIAWESTDPSVATVSGTGLVTAIASGVASISATNSCCVSTSIPVTVQNPSTGGSNYDPYLQQAWTDTVHYEDFTAAAAASRFDVVDAAAGPAPFTKLASWGGYCVGGAGPSGYGGPGCRAQDSVVFANQPSPPWVWESRLEPNGAGNLTYELDFADGNGSGAAANLTRVYVRFSIFFEEAGVGVGETDYVWSADSNKYYNFNTISNGFLYLWYDQAAIFNGQSSPGTESCSAGLTANTWVDYFPSDTVPPQGPYGNEDCTGMGRGGQGKRGVWQHHFVCMDFSRSPGSRVMSWGMYSEDEQGIAGYHDNLTNYNAVGVGTFTDFDRWIWNGTWGGQPKTHPEIGYWFDDLLIMTGTSGSCVTPPSFTP